MEKVFAAFHKVAQFLGQGKSWMVGDVRVFLWPFVGLAIFTLALVVYDVFVR